jgi:predicted nucleic acid-binding protein
MASPVGSTKAGAARSAVKRDRRTTRPPRRRSRQPARRRGYDAVHLACALHLEGGDILLATWDTALNSAARTTGQLIANDIG